MSTFLLSAFPTFSLSGGRCFGDRKYFVTLQKKSQKLPLCFAVERFVLFHCTKD